MKPFHLIGRAGLLIGRRRFVAGWGSLTAAGAVSPAWVLAAQPGQLDTRQVNLVSGFSMAKFKTLIGRTFIVDTNKHGSVTMDLVEVQPIVVNAAQPVKIEQFSLTFRGNDLPMASGVYNVSVGSGAKFALHLKALPLTKGAQPLYRAEFSLLQ